MRVHRKLNFNILALRIPLDKAVNTETSLGTVKFDTKDGMYYKLSISGLSASSLSFLGTDMRPSRGTTYITLKELHRLLFEYGELLSRIEGRAYEHSRLYIRQALSMISNILTGEDQGPKEREIPEVEHVDDELLDDDEGETNDDDDN